MEAPINKIKMPDTTAVTGLLQRNVERLADLQKATLDVLNHQAADVAETMRKALKSTPGGTFTAFFDFAEKGMDGWITAQKNIVDLIVQQSADTVKTTEVRSDYATQSIAKLNELVHQTVDRTAAAQKTMLDFAAKQNEVASKAFQQPGVVPSEVIQSVERGVSTAINTQKEFVDTATKLAKEAVVSAKA